MSNTLDHLVRMANQIALNLARHPDPAAATADHIASFWDPRMKAQIFAHLAQAEGAGLYPIALAAIRRLAEAGAPAHQTRATTFNKVDEAGRSDAG
jgi:formate dehydrogenase subunit delta